MKYYAVIDTNVIVSAMLKWDSIPGNVIEFVFAGIITPILNDAILNEYYEVLLRPKFGIPADVVSDFLEELLDKGVMITVESAGIELPDEDDVVFYEVVLEANKHSDAYLVTGNLKHFPQKSFVVSPREMLEIISSNLE